MARQVVTTKDLEMGFDMRRMEQWLAQNAHHYRRFSQDAVRHGAIRIALASKAATRVAPKTRRVVKHAKGMKRNTNPNLWYIVRNTEQGDKYIPFRTRGGKERVRMSPKAQIKRRGLAQNAWKWMLGPLNSKAGGKVINAGNMKTKNRYFAVRSMLKSFHPAVNLHDKLRYATLAFKTKGKRTVNNIMDRALNAMTTQLQQKIKKRRVFR